mgnify:CR=1 FL=1
MSQPHSLQTLELILEDISAEINLSINSLDHYFRNPKHNKALKKSLSHLKKLHGVYNLLEMPAAQRLLKDVSRIVSDLPKCRQTTRKRLLEAVSVALVRLIRYSEHINQKNFTLPELLLPTINELRSAVNAPILDESSFFECDCNLTRKNRAIFLIISDETAAKSRHFRQMYQIGLIEVLRQTNLSGGLKMMKKAMEKLDNECPRPISPNLWWIAQSLLDAFVSQALVLTKTRLKLFSRLDRQIKYIENKAVNRLDDNKQNSQRLALEMLYLTRLSQLDTKPVSQLLEHFDLEPSVVSDQSLREEFKQMRGPSDQDYSSIVEALLDEVEKIEETLQQALENEIDLLDLEQILNQMINLNNLLKILQVDDQVVRLSVAIDMTEKTIKNQTSFSKKESNILFLVLKSIKNAIDESQLAKYSGVNRKQRNRISESQQEICNSTHVLVNNLIKQLTLFSEQDRNRQHLKQTAQLLLEIQQGFCQLGVEKSADIIDGCLSFVNFHLIRNPSSTKENVIALFADIIGSLEFYLETLEFTAEPSSRILEFAENSLFQLQANLSK